ncbi:MAG: OmpA family protein [Syntrophales bacterium]|jgi:outer membrane protein OmpA-like peptidoglycan-associated protein|nr:OmpA family protein [Syntrophales bacterium]MDY0044134.1 OmpA family protein [Syntrophales bacterium]
MNVRILNNVMVAIFIVSILLMFCACATTPETAVLAEARESYDKARNDASVSKYSPVALYEAKQSLDMAQAAESEKAQEHHAYVAQKKTQLAMVQAERMKAEDEFQELEKKRQEIVLKRRELQIQKAQQETAAAKEEAAVAREQADAAKSELESVRQELEGLKAKETRRGIVVTMEDMLFRVDKADLLPGAMLTIDQMARFLKNHPEYNASIEGHTDSTGTADYNQKLSELRAESVSEALQARGISRDRLTIRGLGENYPVATNETAAGRQLNRRVEIVLKNNNT